MNDPSFCTHVLRLELLPPIAENRLAQGLHEVLAQEAEVGVHHRGGRTWREGLFAKSEKRSKGTHGESEIHGGESKRVERSCRHPRPLNLVGVCCLS